MSKEPTPEREPYSFQRLNEALQNNKTLLNDTVWSEVTKLASIIDKSIPDSLFDGLTPADAPEKDPAPGMIVAIDRTRDIRAMIETVAEYLRIIGSDLYPEKYS